MWRPRPALIVIVVGMIFCATMMNVKSEADHPDSGDARDYLNAAYNLSQSGIFTERLSQPAAPAVGREPGYGAFLSILFAVDPSLEAVTRDCLGARRGCPPDAYTNAQWANRVLAALTGLVMFGVGTLVARHWMGGAIAGSAIWVNSRLLKDLNFLISDALALFLVSLVILLLLLAWRRQSPILWGGAGLALSALTLTKAVFFYYAILLIPVLFIAVFWSVYRARPQTVPLLLSAILFFSAFVGPTGAWMHRNAGIDGHYAITERNRAAVALNTREVFNDFTPAQYAASFIHWTRGFGDNLARALFEPEVWRPFELDNPKGFYNTAVHRTSLRARALIIERGLSHHEAYRRVIDEQISAILARPFTHAAVTLPVIYRGIWADEFALFSFPLLIACFWLSLRRRRWDLLLILSPGAFNLVFYALIAYNIPRHQTTAAPALSLALAIGVLALLAFLAHRGTHPPCRERP